MKVLIALLILLNTTNAWSGVVAPADLNEISTRIAARQTAQGKLPRSTRKILIKDNQIIFQPSDSVTVTFNAHAPTIEKHIRLKNSTDGYAFAAFLKHQGKPFEYTVAPINGADALFCFGERDVFIYTQEEAQDGNLTLKEWIYAKKPNIPNGSQWVWEFKSEPWQWPLTMMMDGDGQTTVNRNMPFAGIPIVDKARSQYMLNVMVKFKSNEPVKQYFPFAELVVSMPQAHVTNKEGITRVADVRVHNVAAESKTKPARKVGFDMRRWDEHWHSVYTVAVPAAAQDYPLLVE